MDGGTNFLAFAEALGLRWRVIALDQRGHGYSDHFPTYARGDYLSDLSQLFARLGLRRSILMGNSLGGVNAYQFAARSPESVPALIVEDAGAVISLDTSFVLNWAGTFENRKDLEERIGPRFLPYLTDSIRQDPNGWRLAFDPPDMEASQSLVNGDHWSDWLATTCPALLIRGGESRVTTQEQLEQMAERRANTQFHTLSGGHCVHFDNLAEFTDVVKRFLERLRA